MAGKKVTFSGDIQIQNKKARFEYELMAKYVAGMALTGTEVKSIRMGKANLQDAYCTFKDQELFVRNLHISPYTMAGNFNHEAKRERKLLLKKRELQKIQTKTVEKGISIIPTRLFFSRGFAKLEIALAKGKKLYDRREDIKEKDVKREMDRTKL